MTAGDAFTVGMVLVGALFVAWEAGRSHQFRRDDKLIQELLRLLEMTNEDSRTLARDLKALLGEGPDVGVSAGRMREESRIKMKEGA